jgi:hypothetical protein
VSTTKTVEPVAPRELEDASLHVAQAASTARIIMGALDSEADAQHAAALLSEYLHGIAAQLSDMHVRQSHTMAREAQS